MQPIIFNPNIAKQKPENVIHTESYCPFCEVETLTDIYRQEGSCIWLANKYRTLEETNQTLVIESDQHLGDQTTYSLEENRHILMFTFDCWQKMLADPIYRSVLLFKNYGPKSGGSLRHPHFQIVGLYKEQGYAMIEKAHFDGEVIIQNRSVTVTLSSKPIMGFMEVNICISSEKAVPQMADYIQTTLQFLLGDQSPYKLDSYNLFFYPKEVAGDWVCKVVPRFTTSPYFIGYYIPQKHSTKDRMKFCQQLKRAYSKISNVGLCVQEKS